ncbi:MAG: CoA transferase [Steroidobacteraceae bacterium]|jgi:CoA:oxalate CoA-transferase
MNPNGPLAGVRVLDLTRVLSGPFCTGLLADLGAEVVKIEAPQGDDYRHIGPFRAGESALYQLVNRNKLGMVFDLKQAADSALVRRLAAVADVFVENFRPGVASRLGVGCAELTAANPRLIYASISGFGQSGSQRDLPAFDLVAQALSGFMAMTGEPDGAPTKVGESIGDLAGGLFCAFGILAALYERERTGVGRSIDVSMVDALVALMPTAIAQWMFGASPPIRSGNRHPLSTPFGTFRAKDGYVVICVLTRAQFAQLAQCMGRPDLSDDPAFATDALRTINEARLKVLIETWLAALGVTEAVQILMHAGVPASQIEEPAAVFEGRQVAERSILSTTQHATLGAIAAMEQPVHFGGLRRGGQRAAPGLGEHQHSVLERWLGEST